MVKTRKRGGSRRKRGGLPGLHTAINTFAATLHEGINKTGDKLRKTKRNLKETVTTAANQAHSTVANGTEATANFMAKAQGAFGTTTQQFKSTANQLTNQAKKEAHQVKSTVLRGGGKRHRRTRHRRARRRTRRHTRRRVRRRKRRTRRRRRRR